MAAKTIADGKINLIAVRLIAVREIEIMADPGADCVPGRGPDGASVRLV
jgi:hypothetical protein